MSLLGAEWVLYVLVLLSLFSVTLIFERVLYYRAASKDLPEFREKIRKAIQSGNWKEAQKLAEDRAKQAAAGAQDLETKLTHALLAYSAQTKGAVCTEVLSETARDCLMRAKLAWDKNLSILATIGSNAPFVGLFGTVLGIIKAFHDLAQQSAAGAQGVSSGISEALVATAVGLLVAIPAVIAFNLFQRRVKSAVAEAEALKSFLIGQLAQRNS